jgi:type VI secretion system protein ImpJ
MIVNRERIAVSVKHLSRTVWAEGMYLGPHHFQAQSRYFEDTIHFSADSLWLSPFGFLGYELDAGALCTFGLDANAANLPEYKHLALQVCFEALDQHVRQHLELVVPTNCLAIRLTQTELYFWEGEITDTRVLGNARWYLSIAADMGEAELITGAPALVKFCSAKFVPELVKRALPGMKLTHVAVPPASLAPRIANQYFTVNRGGPCWDHIGESRRVGLYVPGDLLATELDLLVLLDS